MVSMDSQRFVLMDDSSEKAMKILLDEVDDFFCSNEYLLLDDEDKSAKYVVCGAFGNYINRVYSEGAEERVLDAFRAIEKISEMEDIEVENMIVAGILEVIHFSEHPTLKEYLGKTTKVLFERWL